MCLLLLDRYLLACIFCSLFSVKQIASNAIVRRKFMEFFFYYFFSVKLQSWFSEKWSTLLTAPCVWTSATPVERLSFTRTHYCTNAPSEHASTSPMTTSIQRSHLLSKWENLHFAFDLITSKYITIPELRQSPQCAYMSRFMFAQGQLYLVFSQINEDSQICWIRTFLVMLVWFAL